MLIVFQQQKKYKIKNKSCVIGEVKTKVFATTVNWYKYQLTVASC